MTAPSLLTVGRGIDRGPELGSMSGRKLKALRKDADDHIRGAIQSDAAPDDAAIPAIALLPGCEAEYYGSGRTPPVLARAKIASGGRNHTQEAEETCRDLG